MRFVRLPALLLLVALAGTRLDAAPLQHVSVMLDWYPEAENGGYFYALVHDYYRQAGLDVEVIPAAPNAAVEPQVALGKVDFGLGSSDETLIARARGIPLVQVMGSLQHDPVGIMMHDESPVRGFADLDGHTVAVPPGVPWFLYVVRKFHLDHVRTSPLSFDYAPFLHDPNYIQQVFITSEPPIMKHRGIKVRWIWAKDAGTDAYMALDTSDRFLAAHPDTVRAFIAATIRGWQGYLIDPKSTDAEILRRNPAMNQLQLDLSRQVMIDYHLVDGNAAGTQVGDVDAARMANQYHILRELGIIPRDFDYQAAFTRAYLPASH